MEQITSRNLHLLGAIGTVREVDYQGRPHLVVPIVALMEGVIHAINAETPERVTAKTLAKAASSWNGRPIVLNHPAIGGEQISANDPRVLESQGLGTIFNSRLEGTKLLMDGYVDIEKATRIVGEEFVKNLRAGGGCEVSVGAFVTTDRVAGVHGGKPYKATWLETTGDHLAMLPNGIGACSGKMGCGANRAAMRVCANGLELEVLGAMSAARTKTRAKNGAKSDENARGASMTKKIKALLAPLLKALDDAGEADAGDGGGTGAGETEPDDSAEIISYEAMRALIEQAKTSLDAGSKYVDDLIAAEGVEPEDEDVETARLEALMAMCVQLYGTTNGIMKIAATQLRPEGSTSSYAYMESRAAAGARNSKADLDIIQQTHDNSVKLGADCSAMKAAAATPCGCGGHDMNSTERAASIKTLSEMKDAKFTADELTGLSLLSDASVTKLTTLAAKSPADAIIQAKFAADSALAGHAHGINAKEAADKKKADDDAAMKVAAEAAKVNGTEEKLKAAQAAGHKTVDEHERATFYEKNPEIKALVDGAKKRDAERKTALVTALRAASDRLSEEQLNAKSLEQLEELAIFAQVGSTMEQSVDFSGRGTPRTAEASTNVVPDAYDEAIKARNARNAAAH